jgi:hypothetical protein
MPPLPSRRWTWLFPLTYMIHASEEFFAGERFYNWVSRVAGADLSREDFLAINAIALMVMVIAVLAINATASAAWLTATFGFIVAFNGSLHVVSSLVTWSYSPGTVSGLLVWIPLGVYALRRSYREMAPQDFRRGIIAGVVVHALVMAVAFTV